ncbi:MAG: glycosyltransferase family 4 protein [Verrucomicrobiales bacterium]|nr:glycosyltransferase family 4 protein [Verrucomicrobiales bacterium]
MPAAPDKPRLAYLFSRYPVVSQTFCDSEMLALERMGFDIEIGSLNRPPNSFRHERLDRLKAEIHYPPPPDVLDALCKDPEFDEKLRALVADHSERYGTGYKPMTRARKAFYFAQKFRRLGVRHVHVHFANRATHSALFLKKLGFPFSFTAHAQDFMFDLGSNALLAEMAREAEFVVAVSDYSRDLICEMCPESEDKIVRIYNGIELDDFQRTEVKTRSPLRVVSIGRLIEFKGFQHLIGACGVLKKQEIPVETRIIGEGPMRPDLEARIDREGLSDCVKLLGVCSQEQIKAELAEADLFALASIVDPVGASDILPTVITEAMACHLPVVSTTVTGIPEMVAHGETGLLVEPCDEVALAQAIAELGADAERRAKMGTAGRARADSLFTLEKTAWVLGDRFIKLATDGQLPAHKRMETPIVYLTHRWDGEALLATAPGVQKGVRWIAEQSSWPDKDGDRATLRQMETLPDASVVESIWLRRTSQRQLIENIRGQLGDSLNSTAFYVSARNAVYLADVLPKSGTRHVHAWRSDAILTVWLLKQLAPNLRVSCAVEENPAIPRSLLARLLPAFDIASISDPRVAELSEKPASDDLRLAAPFQRTEVRVGPLRVKRKIAAPKQDRTALENAWLQKLKGGLA